MPGDPLSLILKPAGSRCNLDCLYCYDKRRDLADSGYLSADDLRSFLHLARTHPLNVTLHGGEPLQVPDRRLEEYAAILREHAQALTVSIVTNGLLLTERRVERLRRIWPGIQFSISYDGPGSGSSYRVDYKGRQTGHRVKDAMYILDSAELDYSVFTVATTALQGQEERLLDDLADHSGLRSLRVLPCLDYEVAQSAAGAALRSPRTVAAVRDAGPVPDWALTPSQYTDLVLTLSRAWRDKGLYKRFVLDPTTSVIAAASGGDSGYTDFSWKKQQYILVLSPAGVLSTSDEFEKDTARIGHVSEVSGPLYVLIREGPRRLWNRVLPMMNKCESCSHVDVCRGGNWPDRLAYQRSKELDDEYCRARRTLIDGVLELTQET